MHRDAAAARCWRIMLKYALLRFALASGIGFCASAPALAGDIYKCATPTGTISYQSAPCEGAELRKPTAVVNVVEAPAQTSTISNSARAPAAAGPAIVSASAPGGPDCNSRPREWWRRFPGRRASICIGMTDDEVLNLPGWGRPAKIQRTRAPREWREEWFYDARAAGTRQLWFVNGKLAAVETELEGPSIELTHVATN